ncbi:MAG: N-acetyl-gamma-glutamyl-phosphate reductase, partial [Hyphomicrobiaceae bacterium]
MPTDTALQPQVRKTTAKRPAIFIDGEAGTTGLEIRRMVEAVAGLELKSVAPHERKDPQARLAIMREVDLVVLCLPDAAAKEAVALIGSLGASGPK